MMNRRQLALLPGACLIASAGVAAPAADVTHALRAIERRARGQLGVYALDTATGAEFSHRADERFLMCSTMKLLACALVLRRVDQGQESLARRIAYRRADLIDYAPVTEKHADSSGLSLAELCEAAFTISDNTAANLILASFGGPPALTAFVRSLGDQVTRCDRNEPTLNRWHGDFDTTSPRAMLQTVRTLALGDALAPASRETFQHWMLANTTGGKRLRAGLPADWRIGDKTGTGRDTSNDIGVIWRPQRAPIIVTALLTRSTAPGDVRDEALAAVGRLVAERFA